MLFSLFSLFLLFLSIKHINLELQIKFYKYNTLSTELMYYNIHYFVDYFIDNTFTTELLIGEPPQKIKTFLNPDIAFLFITNSTCLSQVIYNPKKSTNYKFIQTITSKYYTQYRFSDSLSLDNITNSMSTKYIINNYEFLSQIKLSEPLCIIFGTKLISTNEEIDVNFLTSLHKNKNIQSYYFTYELNPRKKEELIFKFDINENTIKEYTFVKTSSYNQKNKQYLVWGLNFEKIIFDNEILYEYQLRAEFDINLECIMASTAFRDILSNYCRKNNIMETLVEFNKKYYIYTFDEKYYDILQNFTIGFYHKESNYHFILNYQDLFYESRSKIYCLIVFDYKEKNYWKFGLPFFRKYKLIFNQDTKSVGFFNDKKNNDIDKKKYYRINGKVILIIVLFFVLVIVGMVFFGILIGKKIYKVRKNKTNELLELYDYNSKSDKNM